MGEARLAEPDVAGLTEATSADTPRQRALDARPSRVEGGEFVGLLAQSRGLEGLMLLLRPHGQGPARVALARAEAAGTLGAGMAILRRELNLDDGAMAV